MSFLEQNEGLVRLSVFAGVLLIMICLEFILPRKKRTQPRTHRWLTNAAIVVLDTVALRLVVPVLAVGFAGLATENGWGLFNLVALPGWLEILLAILILDMLIYAQHVATHHIPILWRFHKVHHVDRDIDVMTALRFHPVEILASMAYKIICVLLLGPAALAVIVFEILLNASAMFNHANVYLPERLDAAMRRLIVTPDMHRVHHSTVIAETNSNYGFFLSVWDRLFGTYIAEPAAGHEGVIIGLAEHQDARPNAIIWSMLLPFLSTRPKASPFAEAKSASPEHVS